MTTYRDQLPQLGDQLFLTDGGIETTLIFHEGLDLPHFASFVLLRDAKGKEALRSYYSRYLDIACETGSGFILEAPTWRANPDWGSQLGYDSADLADANRQAISMLEDLRRDYADSAGPLVLSGNIGPRGDGYNADERMTAAEAEDYHSEQIEAFASTSADMVCAMTMTYAEEAVGIVRAAKRYGMPVAIGFTTETDGRLPGGQPLREAIEAVDAATDAAAAYFMINCAHTEHFCDSLRDGEDWTARVRGLRANASRMSHAELDEAEELDDGDPGEFALLYRRLRERLPQLSVFGGCCGTDHRHIGEVGITFGAAAM
jgi:S-methylmethionine-dependent homocysteine/selenocysteine methylase